MNHRFLLILLIGLFVRVLPAQTIDCAYPIIFIHGWTGNETSFIDVYTDPDFVSIWGPLTDIWHGVMNATTDTDIWGSDGVPGTSDDDVLVQFVNESNNLQAGCIYAVNLENFWNEDPNNPVLLMNDGGTPAFTESDSNESAILKQGYALGEMIDKVLSANPTKSKVILVSHSMGGLMAREYLQRRTPENASGTPRWWVNPSSPIGHRVAKLVTTVTPHRGSNTLGNFLLPTDPKNPEKDALPDLASEAVRDLRYSYACGFLGLDDCPGVYLFGGDEDDFISFPYPYWNEDVDCDGDESSPNVIGINISGTVQGTGDEWDGTYDNPNLPLPTDIRYTWITSDIIGDNGDGVVAWSRQWIYNGSTPYPTDGTAHRLTDTLFTNAFHTDANDDPNLIVRSLDEGDYPAFAWDVATDANFGGLVQYRATQAPEGPSSSDPDWFIFHTPATINSDLNLVFVPHPGLAGRIDFFGTTPGPYTPMSVNGSIFQSWGPGSGPFNLILPTSVIQPDETYYFRVIHTGADYQDWTTPYQFDIQTQSPLPLELTKFDAELQREKVLVSWETDLEAELEQFVVERSIDGRSFTMIGKVPARNSGLPESYYWLDDHPGGGTIYYRLKIKESDGTSNFSPIRSVNMTSVYADFTLRPNPAQTEVWVQGIIPKGQEAILSVFDAMGRPVLEPVVLTSEAPARLLQVAGWPEGWYIVSLKTNRELLHRNLLIQH